MFLSFECVKESDYIGMVTLLKNAHLEFGPPPQVIFTLQSFLAHRLDCNQLLTKFMHCKVNLSKSTFTKDPSDPVEFTSCWWGLVKLLVVQFKHLNQFL